MDQTNCTSHRPYRTLLIAEAANPEWASVPLIGWSLTRALAKLTDAHLVTHVRNRDALRRAGLVEKRDFTSIDNEHIAKPLWQLATRVRGGSGTGWTIATAFSSLAYYSFESALWKEFRSRIISGEFDLVHRITPLSPTHQSPIARRLAKHDVPFVIGPLNGGIPWPKNFTDRQHAEREWLSHVRRFYKLMPSYRSTRRYSNAIIAGSKHTLEEMPVWAKDRCVYIPENAVDPGRFNMPRTRLATLPLQAAFVGRLVPYKGADLLLEAALPFFKEGHLFLHIIGDGPERSLLEGMVDDLGLRQKVSFHGWIPHANVQTLLRACDLMVLPSVREFGGGVVIEAMALGVVPIVANYGGPAELVDDQTGVRVKFECRQNLIKGLAHAIAEFIDSPSKVDRLGAAGQKKVMKKLTWQAKAEQIITVYDAVLNGQKLLKSMHFFD